MILHKEHERVRKVTVSIGSGTDLKTRHVVSALVHSNPACFKVRSCCLRFLSSYFHATVIPLHCQSDALQNSANVDERQRGLSVPTGVSYSFFSNLSHLCRNHSASYASSKRQAESTKSQSAPMISAPIQPVLPKHQGDQKSEVAR